MILRGNLVALLSIGITMISNIISLVRFHETWINTSVGIFLAFMVVSFIIITSLLICRTLKLKVSGHTRIEFRFFSLKNFWVLSGFVLLAFYPFPTDNTIVRAIFTAYAGMAIQIMILRNLTFMIFPDSNVLYPDLISVINEFYLELKPQLKILRPLLDKIESNMKKKLPKSVIDRLNPRKHRWNLIILIMIFSGSVLAFIEGFGDKWLGFTRKSLLLFSVYIGGESAIILLFYGLFGRYLGMVNKEQSVSMDI
jgi:hypothetical protein